MIGVGGETTSPIRNTFRTFPKDELLSQNKLFAIFVLATILIQMQ
jgi:hypothetical protein